MENEFSYMAIVYDAHEGRSRYIDPDLIAQYPKRYIRLGEIVRLSSGNRYIHYLDSLGALKVKRFMYDV